MIMKEAGEKLEKLSLYQIAQINIKILCKLSMDKLADMAYNGYNKTKEADNENV